LKSDAIDLRRYSGDHWTISRRQKRGTFNQISAKSGRGERTAAGGERLKERGSNQGPGVVVRAKLVEKKPRPPLWQQWLVTKKRLQ